MFNVVEKVSLSGSALSPLIWLTALSFMFTGSMYGLVGGSPANICLGLSIALSAATVGCYLWFMFTQPNRLHSESHIEAMGKIALMGDDLAGRMIEGAAVSNPYLEKSDDDR